MPKPTKQLTIRTRLWIFSLLDPNTQVRKMFPIWLSEAINSELKDLCWKFEAQIIFSKALNLYNLNIYNEFFCISEKL